MRRIVLALVASAAMVLSFAIATASSSAAPAPNGHGFTLSGSVVGGVTSAESGQPLTFAFSEKNTGQHRKRWTWSSNRCRTRTSCRSGVSCRVVRKSTRTARIASQGS